jgi:hypothetical protein
MYIDKKEIIEVITGNLKINLQHRMYWLSELDYTDRYSHPSYRVLENFIDKDLKLIEEASYLINSYKAIGIDLYKEIK